MLLNIGVAITCLFLAGMQLTGHVNFFERFRELKNVTIVLWKVDGYQYLPSPPVPLINVNTKAIDSNNGLHRHLIELLAYHFTKLNSSLNVLDGQVNNLFIFDEAIGTKTIHHIENTGVNSQLMRSTNNNAQLNLNLNMNFSDEETDKFDIERIAIVDYLFSDSEGVAALERLIRKSSHLLFAKEKIDFKTTPTKNESLLKPYITLHEYLDSFTTEIGLIGFSEGSIESSATVLALIICFPLLIMMIYIGCKKQTMHIHVGKEFTEGFCDVKSSLTDLLHYLKDAIHSQKRKERRLALSIEEKIDSLMMAFLTLQHETVSKQADVDETLVNATFSNVCDIQHVMRLIHLSELEQRQQLKAERQHFELEQKYKRSLENELREEFSANLVGYTAHLMSDISESEKIFELEKDPVVKETLKKRIAGLMKHREDLLPGCSQNQFERCSSVGPSPDIKISLPTSPKTPVMLQRLTSAPNLRIKLKKTISSPSMLSSVNSSTPTSYKKPSTSSFGRLVNSLITTLALDKLTTKTKDTAIIDKLNVAHKYASSLPLKMTNSFSNGQ